MVAAGQAEKPVALTFSGEIYNFRELRQELTTRGHKFTTRSDTEVVLRSYLEWGASCVERLNGMFAFAIWDSASQELLLVRDRLGVKPLYYYNIANGGLVFGSEIKALLAHPEVPAEIDGPGIAELFTMVPNTTPGTAIFHGVTELRPGWLARIGKDGLRTHPYWELESRPHEDDEKTTVSHIRELLDDIVERQLISDVPVCSLLSGGVDSSAIAALAARQLRKEGQKLHTFAIDYDSTEIEYAPSALHAGRDTPYAELVAKDIDSLHTTHVVGIDDLLAAHDDTLRATDLPSLSTLNISLLLLYRRVKQSSTVALSGESADELFGGYCWYHDETDYGPAMFPWHKTYVNLVGLLSPAAHDDMKPEQYLANRYETSLAEVPRLAGETRHDRRIREVFYLTNQHYLRWLLQRKDRMSMAAGVEARVPFCDHRLVEYAWNIPWEMKNTGGMEKGILRKAIADVLPHSVAWRKKSGYPAAQILQYQQVMWGRMREVLAENRSPVLQFVDRAAVSTLLDASEGQLSEWSALHHITYLLEMCRWFDEYQVSIR